MLELIKKGLFAGIGAVVVTKQKVMEAAENLVKEGKLSTSEAERLSEDLVKSGERQWEEITANLHETMKKWTDNLEMARRKDIEALEARIEALEKRLQEEKPGEKEEKD